MVYTHATRSNLCPFPLSFIMIDTNSVFSSHLGFILPRNSTTEVFMLFDLFKVAMLNFHSFDWQCFGAFVISQLTSGDSLSVGIAHIHMVKHNDFSVLPSSLRSSRGSLMLAKHCVKLFYCCKSFSWFGLLT